MGLNRTLGEGEINTLAGNVLAGKWSEIRTLRSNNTGLFNYVKKPVTWSPRHLALNK